MRVFLVGTRSGSRSALLRCIHSRIDGRSGAGFHWLECARGGGLSQRPTGGPGRVRRPPVGEFERIFYGHASSSSLCGAATHPTRISPSWTTVASMAPSEAKKWPLARPREPDALGECVSYSTQSSTLIGRWNHMA